MKLFSKKLHPTPRTKRRFFGRQKSDAGYTPIVDFGIAPKARGKRPMPKFTTGYTLLELAVVLFIILTITVISRTSKTAYERSFALSNLAYDIALTLREAQVYGVNTRQEGISGSFDAGYGVRFAENSTDFTLFVDNDNDRFYDSPGELLRVYTIKNNNKISEICTVPVGTTPGQETVACADNRIAAGVLDITYRRPDPDACFNRTGGGLALPAVRTASDCMARTQISEARITVQAPRGETKVIKVYSTGQVVMQ